MDSHSNLLTRYRDLQQVVGPTSARAERGRAFERLLADLFQQHGVPMREAYRMRGEEIDGAFEYKGGHYLVEAKWKQKKTSTQDLLAFEGKVSRRLAGTRGLFVSFAGFEPGAVERLGQGRQPALLLWSAPHLEALLEGRFAVQELLDRSLARAAERGVLLLPESELVDDPTAIIDELVRACRTQVDREIRASVGPKYIPELYVARGIQEQIETQLQPTPSSMMRREGRIHVLLGKAGSGKTNLLCDWARRYVEAGRPCVFLSARSAIADTTAVQSVIAQRLFPFGSPDLLFARAMRALQQRGILLLVLIDSLNEHRRLEHLSWAIGDYLHAVQTLPLQTVATCRDIYWPFIETATWPRGQWMNNPLSMANYSSSEAADAIPRYLRHYRLTASLGDAARRELTDPLILRFFCEAYADPNEQEARLGNVADIRLKTLFDVYLNRKLESLRYASPVGRRGTYDAERMLTNLTQRIRTRQRPEITREEMREIAGTNDLDSPSSSYVNLLGEDIIIEEVPDKEGDVRVSFTYEAFMEYMVARQMLKSAAEVTLEQATELFQECARGLKHFPQFAGIAEFLCLSLFEDHGIVPWEIAGSSLRSAAIRAIGKASPPTIGERELHLLETWAAEGDGVAAQALLCALAGSSIHSQDVTHGSGDALLRLSRNDSIDRQQFVAELLPAEKNIPAESPARPLFDWVRAIKRVRLVLCDDEALVVRAIKRMVDPLDLSNVATFHDAHAALQHVSAHGADVVVTDYRKPQMDGLTMTRELKKLSPAVKVIMLGGGSPHEESDTSPYFAYIGKPFIREQLVGLVVQATVEALSPDGYFRAPETAPASR